MSERRTSLPTFKFVLAFSLITVFIISLLIGKSRYALVPRDSFAVAGVPAVTPPMLLLLGCCTCSCGSLGVMGFGMMFRLDAARKRERADNLHRSQVVMQSLP